MNTTTDPFLDEARKLHASTIVIDSHCDTTQRLVDPTWGFCRRHDDGHVDLPRLREGGVDGLFMAVWASPWPESDAPGGGRTSLRSAARRQIRWIHDLVANHADQLALAHRADDIIAARSAGKTAIVVVIEGGHLIDQSLDCLREYRSAGAAYLTLTHAAHTTWADSSGVHEPLPPRHGGLTDFGREVVKELNRLGMMVDVSHVSDACVEAVLDCSTAPIIASHSSCRSVSPHVRNLSDDLMRRIAASGGVIQINFAANFIDPNYPAIDPAVLNRWMNDLAAASAGANLKPAPLTDHVTPLSVLADHFDRAIEVVGVQHVGFGSDFDGVPHLPEGMEDCSKLPYLTAELLRRGHAASDIAPMLGENLLRVMRRCEDIGREMRDDPRKPESATGDPA